jgi:hypothetical protein
VRPQDEDRGMGRLGIAVVAAAALLAAGCGGSDDEPTATDWANDLCGALTDWTGSISSAVDTLRGGNLSQEAVDDAFDEAENATNTLVDDLRALGPPETDAGQQADDSVQQLSDDLESGMDTIDQAIDDASGGTGILDAVSVVSGTLSTMGDQVSSTIDALEQLDAQGELEQAFQDASACDELTR